MSRISAALVAAGLVLGTTAAWADAPPQNAQPLSRLIAAVERQDDFAYFKEIDWDDDGYYEVEYRTRGGGDREVRIDPVTGQAKPD